MKRISFSQSDATCLYEYLRFYWHEDFLKHPEFWKSTKKNKFGGCPECTNLGVRLEKFIGEKAVKYTDKLIKESGEKVKSPKF